MIPDSRTNSLFQTTPAPDLTVAIPTRNRSRALGDLLDSIAAQALDRDRFEVLVLDDGSDEEHRRALMERLDDPNLNFALAAYLRPNAGPAAARNRMTEAARGRLVLFLNDDVILDPGHLETHLRLHEENPEPATVVRGVTRWEPIGRDTAVMRYLRSRLFVYDLSLSEEDKYVAYFHTCDLSLKREILIRFPFDERFPTASFEDSELGFRLQWEAGLRLILAREAVSHHRHDYRWRDLILRAWINGHSAALLLEKYPVLYGRLRAPYGAEGLNGRARRILRCVAYGLTGRFERFWEMVDGIVYAASLDRTRRAKKSQRDFGAA